jgi:hypothetical protein
MSITIGGDGLEKEIAAGQRKNASRFATSVPDNCSNLCESGSRRHSRSFRKSDTTTAIRYALSGRF